MIQYSYTIKFNQVYVSKPVMFEVDGEPRELFPHEARLRNLTYSAPVFVDVSCKQYKLDEDKKFDPANDVPVRDRDIPQHLLAYVPIMLRCRYCILAGRNDLDLTKVGECVFDQGGYFVINGSEKVLIAQETMSANTVYVFAKKDVKYLFVGEIKSVLENSSRPYSSSYSRRAGEYLLTEGIPRSTKFQSWIPIQSRANSCSNIGIL